MAAQIARVRLRQLTKDCDARAKILRDPGVAKANIDFLEVVPPAEKAAHEEREQLLRGNWQYGGDVAKIAKRLRQLTKEHAADAPQQSVDSYLQTSAQPIPQDIEPDALNSRIIAVLAGLPG